MKKVFTLCFVVSLSIAGKSQTWNQDIAPIFYDHCGKCHHDGGIAPMSLVTYAEAEDESGDIEDELLEGTMPPWPANPNYQHFIGENVLSPDEETAILNWIEAGAPEGTGSAPAIPTYQDGYQLADPDEIVGIPAYEVPEDDDVYRSFVIPSTSNEDRYIGSIEFDPDNEEIVHHILAFYDPSDASQELDDADPLPGFPSNGGSFPSDDAVLIGVWVPGMGHTVFPENLAIPLPAGSDFVFEVHYAPESLGGQADVKMRLKYKEDAVIREVYHDPLLYHFWPSLQEPVLFIPANTTQTFHEESDISPVDISLISVFPHMHLLGKKFKVYGLTAEEDTIKVIDVDQYDFHWQFSYWFPFMKKLPAGAQLFGEAFYDNTEENDDNPSFPPQNVSLGENTTDEMMVCFFMYTLYHPGDENISLVNVTEAMALEEEMLFAFPNPANEMLLVDIPNNVHRLTSVQLMDANGKLSSCDYRFSNGRMTVETSSLAPGLYHLSVQAGEKMLKARFVKQ